MGRRVLSAETTDTRMQRSQYTHTLGQGGMVLSLLYHWTSPWLPAHPRHLRHVEPSVLVAFSLCVEHDSVQGMVDHGNTTVEHDCQLGNPLDPPEGGIAYKGGRPAGIAPSGEPTFVGVAGCLGAAGLGEAGGLTGSCPMPS